MPSPYEMYMQKLSAPVSPMGRDGAVYGARDNIMRKGMRSDAAQGQGAPFGLAPLALGGGTMPGPVPGSQPPAGGPPRQLSGEAIDNMKGWGGGGGNSDQALGFLSRNTRDSVMGRGPKPGPEISQPMDLGAMTAQSQQPQSSGLLGGENPMMKLGGVAGLLQAYANSPGGSMAAPVNGGHFAGTGAGGLFNKGGLLGMFGRGG